MKKKFFIAILVIASLIAGASILVITYINANPKAEAEVKWPACPLCQKSYCEICNDCDKPECECDPDCTKRCDDCKKRVCICFATCSGCLMPYCHCACLESCECGGFWPHKVGECSWRCDECGDIFNHCDCGCPDCGGKVKNCGCKCILCHKLLSNCGCGRK